MIRKIIRPPKPQKTSGKDAIIRVMLDIAEGHPPAPGAPHISLHILKREYWGDWETVTIWLWPDDRRRVQRWLDKLGLLPEENQRRREMIGRVTRFKYPIPGDSRSEEEAVFETALDIFEGKINTTPPPPQIPVRILSRDRWGSEEIILIKIYKADYLRVKRWMVKVGLLPKKGEK